MSEEDLKATKIQVQVLEEILSYKDKEISRLKREKDIVIKLNHFLAYEVKRILKDDDLSHIEKLQEISKVFEEEDKE